MPNKSVRIGFPKKNDIANITQAKYGALKENTPNNPSLASALSGDLPQIYIIIKDKG